MDLMLNPLSDIAIDLAQPQLDERVIDIGCGCGADEYRASSQRCEVWGMDVSASMLSRARERASSYPESLFTEADASVLSFRQTNIFSFPDLESCFLPIRLKLL